MTQFSYITPPPHVNTNGYACTTRIIKRLICMLDSCIQCGLSLSHVTISMHYLLHHCTHIHYEILCKRWSIDAIGGIHWHTCALYSLFSRTLFCQVVRSNGKYELLVGDSSVFCHDTTVAHIHTPLYICGYFPGF